MYFVQKFGTRRNQYHKIFRWEKQLYSSPVSVFFKYVKWKCSQGKLFCLSQWRCLSSFAVCFIRQNKAPTQQKIHYFVRSVMVLFIPRRLICFTFFLIFLFLQRSRTEWYWTRRPLILPALFFCWRFIALVQTIWVYQCKYWG